MSNEVRVVGAAAFCVVAAVAPFIAGDITAVLGLALLAGAVWLIAGADWPVARRVVASAVAVGATVALVVVFLVLATLVSGD